MGGGVWTTTSFNNYVTTNMGFSSVTAFNASDRNQIYTAKKIDPLLDPKDVVRECRDSEEHPNTIPVILALDVTGSMGNAAVRVAKELNTIMSELYKSISDVEFMIMGIGDLAFDCAPIQAGQFESDIRIMDQTSKIYFEGGGGGNAFESYSAAWYFGLYHTDLDCWKRGKKGIIITMGDEPLNPYLPGNKLSHVLHGSNPKQVDASVDTSSLYHEVAKKYDVYHLAIDDEATCYDVYKRMIEYSFKSILGDHFRTVTLDSLGGEITNIILEASKNNIDGELGISDSKWEKTEEGIKW